jgi:hypothetical protein
MRPISFLLLTLDPIYYRHRILALDLLLASDNYAIENNSQVQNQ